MFACLEANGRDPPEFQPGAAGRTNTRRVLVGRCEIVGRFSRVQLLI